MSVRYELRPFTGGTWTDPETTGRVASRFRASWPDTLELLKSEAEHLGAPLVVLQIDITEADLRRDGELRTRTHIEHPGVVVSLDSRYGPLRYATDTFREWDGTSWQANVRAIALAMQALRAVDRYGVTKRGEQYAGWRAIPAGASAGFGTVEEARRWMREQAGPKFADASFKAIHRILALRFHPDHDDRPEDWARLDAAWRLIEAGGSR